METYQDYVSPLVAAGATQRRNGSWVLPNGCGVVNSARHALDALDLEQAVTPLPKARTFKAIKKEVDRLASRYERTASIECRAVQYAAAMRGEETPHSTCFGSAFSEVKLDRAPDGSKRARFVGEWEIPHWDFTPEIEELNICDDGRSIMMAPDHVDEITNIETSQLQRAALEQKEIEAMEQFAIGTPVIDPYGVAGFISAAKAPESKVFVISAGMKEVRTEYECCFESGRISTLGDGIVAPFVTRAKHLPAVDNVEERKAAIQALVNEKHEAARIAADEAGKLAAASRIEAQARTPAWAQAVIVAELVSDRSDTMTDYFGSTTTRTVVLGFSKHKRDLFAEMRKFAALFPETAHLVDAPESAEHREKYSMGAGYYLKKGFRNSGGWQIRKLTLYRGADSMPSGCEWLSPEAVPAVELEQPAATSTAMLIEEHRHTKKGFKMFIAIMGDRVERAEFDRLRDAAQELGGWYSRPWGGTPGGFAFKDRSKAETFAGGQPIEAEAATIAPDEKPAVVAPAEKAARIVPGVCAKLRDLAEGLQGDIDSKFANRLTNTPKRRREADSARLIGYQLERTQQALRALADLHDAGTVPAILAKVTTKARALELMRSQIDRTNAGYYDAGIDTGKPALDTPEALALWALVSAPSAADKEAEELRRKVDALQFAKIPGYFPTPAALVAEMIEAADIPEGEVVDVLEPEAGSGAILDAVKAARPNARLVAYERHASLRDVLKLKGYDLAGSDFLEAQQQPAFDYVLMNPPFEVGQDMQHVRHAFGMLKPGGRLVAIMSPGPFFRSDRKAQEFRTWFDELGGEKRDIAAGAFKMSGTGVATVMVTLFR